MGRRLLGLLVSLALFGAASAIMFLAGVPIADYLPTVVGCMIAAGLIVLAWTFKPEIDRIVKGKETTVTQVTGDVGVGVHAEVTITKPKRNWQKIGFFVYAGFLIPSALIYAGFRTYAILPKPIPPTLFLPVITLVAGGIFIALMCVYYIVQLLRP